MKFLFLTDSHWRAGASKYRIDDVLKSQIEELNELEEICKIYKPEFLLHGGDVVHTPAQPHSIVSTLLEWGSRLNLPIYSVKGNHDQVGYSDISTSALKTLFSSKVFTELNELIIDNVIVRGIHAHIDCKEGNYIFEDQWKDFFKIVVTHNYISNIPLPFDHIHPKDVVTNANLILVGHLHHPWTWNNKVTTFINPGSLGRWNIEEANRRPKVLIVETSPFSVIEVPLKCSKMGEELFNLQAAMEIKSNEMNLQNFVDSLKGASFDQADVEQVVLQEGKKQNIAQEIIDMALDKVRLAKEELK